MNTLISLSFILIVIFAIVGLVSNFPNVKRRRVLQWLHQSTVIEQSYQFMHFPVNKKTISTTLSGLHARLKTRYPRADQYPIAVVGLNSKGDYVLHWAVFTLADDIVGGYRRPEATDLDDIAMQCFKFDGLCKIATGKKRTVVTLTSNLVTC